MRPEHDFFAVSNLVVLVLGLITCLLAAIAAFPWQSQRRANPGKILPPRLDPAPAFRPLDAPKPLPDTLAALLERQATPGPVYENRQADPLTGLPTRRVFAAQLQSAIRQAQSEGGASSLLLVNLQGRESIVARHGRQAGDQALCEVTRRLQAMLKKSEIMARLGEDEFAVIAEGAPEPAAHREAALQLAERMMSGIRHPVPAGLSSLSFGAGIGIALCRSGVTDAADLLQNAAAAMHRAYAGATGFELFEPPAPDLLADLLARNEDLPLQDLLQALASGQIRPFYQPVVDLATNRICGFEALARWQHPSFNMVPPDRFIPVLERNARMAELTETILRQACRDLRTWPKDIKVAINVSPSELSGPRMATRLLGILEQEAVAPTRLEIEVTETAPIRDIPAAKANLAALRQAGIITALDDFGTGYASLEQLRQLQFDRLKIDRSFVQGMLQNRECSGIVEAILGLAHNLNLGVIAEGIEEEKVAADLAARGCDFGQGFYYSAALPARAAGLLLKTALRRPAAA